MRITAPRLTSSGRVLDFIITFKGNPLETKGRVVHISSDRTHAGIHFEQVLCSKGEGSPEFREQIPFDPAYSSEEILT